VRKPCIHPIPALGPLPSEEAFAAHLRRTQEAGLANAVNMDTGYANYLSDEEKERVLRLTRDALGRGVKFVAGAYVEGREGDLITLYRREIERIVEYGGTPILFQTSRLHGRPAAEKVETYRRAVEGLEEALAFELGRMFAPNGEIFDEETVRGLMEIPELAGMKHSSLDRMMELGRLALRDRVRPDFRIYTGNDLGIDMVEYGSDYLLGLATFHPEAFAARDRAWADGDPAYFLLSDALQHLGNVAFRPPVPAYKHSAAIFLHLRGRIPTPNTHPQSAHRPEWEPEILRACAERLDLMQNAK
jgi:dihydrodipicolinate synthase/N-acetylneuraminate lyase